MADLVAVAGLDHAQIPIPVAAKAKFAVPTVTS
jgi:hypothetical protein